MNKEWKQNREHSYNYNIDTQNHQNVYTQTQEEVIDKDEHIKMDTQTWTYILWDEPSMHKKSNW